MRTDGTEEGCTEDQIAALEAGCQLDTCFVCNPPRCKKCGGGLCEVA